jgi:hypothetical protein
MPFLTVYQDARSYTIENALKEKDVAIQQLIRQMEMMNRRTEVLESLVKNPKQLMEMSTT